MEHREKRRRRLLHPVRRCVSKGGQILLWACLSFVAVRGYADGDKPLLRINGESVYRQEFESFCRRNAGHSELVEGCLERFVALKLKAADARVNGWDTLPAFRQECKVLQGKVLRNILLDSARMKAACEEQSAKEASRCHDNGWVKMGQITALLPQHATKREEEAAKCRMDSIYAALKRGVPFPALSGKAGGPQWFPAVSLLSEFTEQLEKLSEGEFSPPFFSPLGIHIVRLEARREGALHEGVSASLCARWDRSGRRHPALNPALYADWLAGKLRDTSAMKEARDELLARYWDKVHASSFTDAVRPEELEEFFARNRKRYRWELPHFKGAVIHCRDRKEARQIRRRLKRAPFRVWKEVLSRYVDEHPSCNVSMETGLFRIGSNAYVDKLAFGCGELPADASRRYSFVLGKRLKKGPESYLDVLDAVAEDCRDARQEQQMQELKRRLGVEIDREVLKTVNCSGSN